ncbi:MAG: hypothetical protein IPM98_10520 [Lewinellaceae bacterium]|nr:hypothetical protein [Lewinellaceae bacterium]
MQKPLFSALLLALSLFAFGCGKTTDTPDSADRWIVSMFTDLDGLSQVDKDDDTARFSGFSFEFNTGNLLTINMPDGTSKEAKWRLESNDTILTITMENPSVLLGEIMGNWDVKEYSATSIKLANPGGTDASVNPAQALVLEFVKL